MRGLLMLAIAGLLLGAALVALIEYDPGYLLLRYGHTSIETSLWLGGVLWLGAWLALAGLWRTLRLLLQGQRSFRGWLGGRKARNAAALTNRGLINFIEGNWLRARKQLLRAARHSETPLVNHLLAARASFRLGDTDAMRQHLGIAEDLDAGAGVAVELTQAELQLSAGQYEQALATLVRARRNANKHPYVLELLARAYRQLGDWTALQGILAELRRYGLRDEMALNDLERDVWHGLLARAAEHRGTDEAALESLWQSIPLTQRELPLMQRLYVQTLLKLGSAAKAQRSLSMMLDKNWDTTLLELVGAFPPADAKKLLKLVNRWLNEHGREPALLLAAGRVALHAGQWSEAHDWLQGAYNITSSVEVCILLARLQDAQGDAAAAEAYRAEALTLTAPQTTRLPMPNTV